MRGDRLDLLEDLLSAVRLPFDLLLDLFFILLSVLSRRVIFYYFSTLFFHYLRSRSSSRFLLVYFNCNVINPDFFSRLGPLLRGLSLTRGRLLLFLLRLLVDRPERRLIFAFPLILLLYLHLVLLAELLQHPRLIRSSGSHLLVIFLDNPEGLARLRARVETCHLAL